MTVFKKAPGKFLSLGFLIVGVFILMQIILPVISFQMWAVAQKTNNQILVSPADTNEQVLGISVERKDNFPAFVSSLKRETQGGYDTFNLSVPRLKIDREDVFADTNDLSKGLIHLPGSSLPGEKGNVFITGHSAFSQLFNLESVPFAKLSDLKKGDQITLETPSTKFVYEVIGFKIVNPSDLSVLQAPDSQGRYVSLMTCVPPGLNFKRLVVLGKMI